jgi:hypothetical protein
MVEFFSIIFVAIPPIVSIDNDNGVTSRRRISPVELSPAKTAPCSDAPQDTHSSGFKFLFTYFPKIDFAKF